MHHQSMQLSYYYVFCPHFICNHEVKFEEGNLGFLTSDFVEILNWERFVIGNNSGFKERDS